MSFINLRDQNDKSSFLAVVQPSHEEDRCAGQQDHWPGPGQVGFERGRAGLIRRIKGEHRPFFYDIEQVGILQLFC